VGILTQQNTLVLLVQGEMVHGLELASNVRELQFTFHSVECVLQMSTCLSEMCKKAHEMRGVDRERPFDAPHMVEGLVHRVIRTGGCFGSTEFMSGTVSGKFKCIASEKTVILELTPQMVGSIIDRDYVHGALFYWTLCKVMDLDYREAMEEMFPGTWSRRDTEI